MARHTRFLLQLMAGAIHLVLVGGAFAAVSAVLWLLLCWSGTYWSCTYQPSFFEAAGMLAFGYILFRSSSFAHMQAQRMRRVTLRRLIRSSSKIPYPAKGPQQSPMETSTRTASSLKEKS